MNFKIYIEDLKEDWLPRIYEVLRYDLADEIEEAIASGANREVAEQETLSHYLNTHNFGWNIEI